MNWYNNKIKAHPNYNSKKLTVDIDILYPPFAFLVIKTFALSRSEKLRICIYETYRSQGRQLDLFNQGKTKLSTNGMHHFGVATDIVFLNEKSQPSWDGKYNWKRLGEIGKSLGLTWGGDWGWDNAHFQFIPVKAQAKIVSTNYPTYDLNMDQKIIELCTLYNDAQKDNFPDESIVKILSCFDNTPINNTTPQTEVIQTAPTVVRLLFFRDLVKGCSGEDVKLLQRLLNTDPATRVASAGVGSPGQESDYFGDLTKQAVQKFQTKYSITLVGSGEYGIVGEKTRNKLQELFKK